MRYYNAKRKTSVDTRKILFRILFVVVAAAVITGITVAVGKSLQKKVADVEENSVELPANTGLQTERRLDESAIYVDYSPTVFGSAVSIPDHLSDGEGTAGIRNEVQMIAEYYDTLTIDLSSADGSLIYPSKALESITRLPDNGDDEAEKMILAALDEAKDKNLRTCALISPVLPLTTISGAASIDSTLITELGDMGFDEVLLDFTKILGNEIDYESSSRIRTYLRECATMSGDVCRLGVVLSGDAFLNSANAKQIQTVADTASFIAVKFDLSEVYITTQAYNSISDAVTSLLGNFSVYNMRVMIDSPFTLISGAVYIACTTHGVNNVSFASFIEPSELTYADLPTAGLSSAEAEEEPDEDKNLSNPYATTKDNPSIGDDRENNSPTQQDGTVTTEDGDEMSAPSPWF